MSRPDVFFFGSWDRPGHFIHNRHGGSVPSAGPFMSWQLDGTFAPKTIPHEDETKCQVEHLYGWTVLAMWDRTVDRRGACNAAFIAEGEHDEATMWELAREAFPKIVARLKAAQTVTP